MTGIAVAHQPLPRVTLREGAADHCAKTRSWTGRGRQRGYYPRRARAAQCGLRPHGLLLQAWGAIRRRLALYWAAHHRAHGRRGPRRNAHDDYIRHAVGDDLTAMRAEPREHMQRGLATVLHFIQDREKEPPS